MRRTPNESCEFAEKFYVSPGTIFTINQGEIEERNIYYIYKLLLYNYIYILLLSLCYTLDTMYANKID